MVISANLEYIEKLEINEGFVLGIQNTEELNAGKFSFEFLVNEHTVTFDDEMNYDPLDFDI